MTALTGIKLLVEFGRYFYMLKNNEENLWLYFMGKHMLMTILFAGFFMFSNQVFFSEGNNCAESPSTTVRLLYSFFSVFFVISYLVFFYLIVTSCVLCQSAWLIRSMVNHRIEVMRRRDAMPEG
eukprot:CAMPEP_0176357638 /NCGR_PEP_ID=MMETSP0126-20121128/14930_1 /TAXON_ID=141414 ORGANISM="Strombidinopsis acuminatum, Strain SPMC142" /NCGR_SAMPLE_ID=MMETSP0126 /ASSEMBLY_ACC=CAM_ASM_000229 /LENGTH=123 /DNA_ID=CAMNT_0017711359 /DNA_START=463 /DNA_END=834 /DNA_ORIENTATION=-